MLPGVARRTRRSRQRRVANRPLSTRCGQAVPSGGSLKVTRGFDPLLARICRSAIGQLLSFALRPSALSTTFKRRTVGPSSLLFLVPPAGCSKFHLRHYARGSRPEREAEQTRGRTPVFPLPLERVVLPDGSGWSSPCL